MNRIYDCCQFGGCSGLLKGSVDLFMGPGAPKGKEKNWVLNDFGQIGN